MIGRMIDRVATQPRARAGHRAAARGEGRRDRRHRPRAARVHDAGRPRRRRDPDRAARRRCCSAAGRTTCSPAAVPASRSTSSTRTRSRPCSTWSSGADVLVEGMRPGVAERLGLGPDDCWARNPRLVYGRMTGWGQDGPWAQSAGHDLNYIAVDRRAARPRPGPARPHFPTNLLGDFGGGSTYLVIGVLAALLEARTSGEGQVVDAAIVDGTAHLNAMAATFAAARASSPNGGAAGCSTAARRTTTSTRPPTAGTCRSARWSRSSTTTSSSCSASRTSRPTATTRAHLTSCASCSPRPFRQRTQAEWAEVFDGHRRLRRAGAADQRGGGPPAPRGPRDLRRASTASSSPRPRRGSAARRAAVTDAARRAGAAHPRGADRLGRRRRRRADRVRRGRPGMRHVKPFLFLGTRAEDAAADNEYAAVLRCAGLDERDLRRVRLERDELGHGRPRRRGPGSCSAAARSTSATRPSQKSPVQRRVEAELRAAAPSRSSTPTSRSSVPATASACSARSAAALVDRTYGEPIGCVEVTLTDDGRSDPLLRRPAGVLRRASSATRRPCRRLPRGAVLLAGSAACPVQAFRLGAARLRHPVPPRARRRGALPADRHLPATTATSRPSRPRSLMRHGPRSVVTEPPADPGRVRREVRPYDEPRRERTEHVDVLIVGAGLSGIGAAARLTPGAPAPQPTPCSRRATASGGTWDLFRYPGIRSDSDMFTMGYRFRPWRERPGAGRRSVDPGLPARHRPRVRRRPADPLPAPGDRAPTGTPRPRAGPSTVETATATVALTAAFLWACSGYYDYRAAATGPSSRHRRVRRPGGPPAALARGPRHAGKRVNGRLRMPVLAPGLGITPKFAEFGAPAVDVG